MVMIVPQNIQSIAGEKEINEPLLISAAPEYRTAANVFALKKKIINDIQNLFIIKSIPFF